MHDQVTVSNVAQGNTLSGGIVGDSAEVRSSQTMRGDARATVDLTLGGDTEGMVDVVSQARGNYLAGTAQDGALALDTTQVVDGGRIAAGVTLDDDDARLIGGGRLASAAVANTVALGGQGAALTGTADQSSSAETTASTYVAVQYAPGPTDVSSQAVGNLFSAVSDQASHQDLSVRQRSTGPLVQAGTSANAGNAWDLVGRAQAVANQAAFHNQGGSLLARADQANQAHVRAETVTTAYDYGAAVAHASAAANSVTVGNSDIHVEIDNLQLNTGGVMAVADFAGAYGYDAYVGADAVGNSVVGYACADCPSVMTANNNQTNDGNVTASVNATMRGGGRATIAGANATGNAATFYVSRPTTGD